MHAGIAERVFGLARAARRSRSASSTIRSPPVSTRRRRAPTRSSAAAPLRYGLTAPRRRSLARVTRARAGPSSARSTARGETGCGRRRQSRWRSRWRCVTRGVDVPLDPGSLARRSPAPPPPRRLRSTASARPTTPGGCGRSAHVPYGDRLDSELGYTPLFVRYNSGLHISHNGRALGALMEELAANWPVPVAEIAFVGHSMGGLVARGACHYAQPGSWRELVRHIFMLGSPHKGAPLELAANAACHALSRLPETRPFATPIKVRAAGVKDLGYGYVVDEDWEGHDPDAFWSTPAPWSRFWRAPITTSSRATLTRDAEHPVGRLIGDLLVLPRERLVTRGPRRAAAVPHRSLQPPGWRQPLRSAQPPRGLRPAAPLVDAHRQRGIAASSAAVAPAAEHQLLGQGGPGRGRGVSPHRHGLGDAEGDRRRRPVELDRRCHRRRR